MLKYAFLLGVVTAVPQVWAASYFTERPDDPTAVYLTKETFAVHGDGIADDTTALQAAINKVQETTRHGIVFVPEGRYRLTSTVYIWPGVRVIGYGASRPVFVLADNTPGFGDPNAEKYLVFFAGGRPGFGRRGPQRPGRPGRPVSNVPPDASPGTFYSALSNVDIEIGQGNDGASAVHAHYAQHSFVAHVDMHLGSALAGIHEAGNVIEDVRFIGGRYGIWTHRSSPGWQITLVDTAFEGQREAAIREGHAGLTLVRPQFKNVPAAIEIEDGFTEQLWVKNGRMENVTGPAVTISVETSTATHINMENVVCRNVPIFAAYRESGKKVAAPGSMYEVKVFSHGLHYADITAEPDMKDVFETAKLSAMPPPVPSDLTPLPPQNTWVNVRTLGAKGDGKTDDTAVLKKAVAEHQAVYLPMGRYVITDTLTLKPNTVLIGLHPSMTVIGLLDSTPGFQGVGGPKPLVETPKGGPNILIGIGIYPNGINPRAHAVMWRSGANSLMNDVRLLGGHGTTKMDGTRETNYNNNRTGDGNPRRRWDTQYPSLWVTDGGGGTFMDIWTPDTFAQAGMMISDTSTPGRVYEISSEHHVRHELQIRNASNWEIYAFQTEEERGESEYDLPIEIVDSSNITLANFLDYRVISSYQPFPWVVKVANSKNIRFRNFHCYSNSKVSHDTAVYDQTHDIEFREREFAWLDLSGSPEPRATKPVPVMAAGAKVEELSDGFYNISGGAAAPNGDLYFVDAYWNRIYRWDAEDRQISTERDSPLEPVNLAIDKAGNIMVVSYAGDGAVYTFKPGTKAQEITLIEARPAAPRPNMTAVLPVSDFSGTSYDRRLNATVQPGTAFERPRPCQYVSPDGTMYIAADEPFSKGTRMWGIKGSPLLRTFGLQELRPGEPAYFTEEYGARTYRADIGTDGQVRNIKVFAERGGEDVAVDADGNAYIAAGQIYVYSPDGKAIGMIETPKRPTQLVFGGRDGKTLYILARSSLFAVRMKVKGR